VSEAAPSEGSLRRAPTRRLALLVILASAAAMFFPATASEPPRTAEKPAKIEIRARPIPAFDPREEARKRFGALEFRGGLELSSDHPNFGGISAIAVTADGERFLAVSDRGRWLRGRIVAVGERPLRVVDAEMAPILGTDGRPIGARGWYDTESLTEDGGTVYVGIERVNRILKFDYGRDGLLAPGQPINLPAGVRQLSRNKGLEALFYVPRGALAGTLIGISEMDLDSAGNIRGFLIGGPAPGSFSLVRHDDFDVTAAALAPDGDVIVLERRFTFFRGAGMRMRKIPLASFKPGAVLEGAVLFEADRSFAIDNMEGLAIHRNARGEIILTLISDDNFNPLQRTILLRFALVAD
jgi:hypothetical protein